MCINILMADDHYMVREGLKKLFESDDNICIVGEASDGEEAIVKTLEINPDILILDINMPEKNGLEVLNELKKKKIETKILMLTTHEEPKYILKAIELKCDGYVSKKSDFKTLKTAVYSLHNNIKFIQMDLIEKQDISLGKIQESNEKIADLTKRENEVLKLIAEGLLNKEIASKLNISERTVKNHVSNIFKKVDVSDRTQAAVFAIRNNLVNI